MHTIQKITAKLHSEPNRDTYSSHQLLGLKLGALLLTLSPSFANYVAITQISLGDLCVILAVILCMLSVRLSQFLIISLSLVAPIVFISLLILTSKNTFNFSFLRACFYLIAALIFLSIKSDFYIFIIKRYQAVVTVFMSLLIAQSIFYLVTDKVINLQLPLSVYEEDTLIVRDVVTQGFRTGGVFKEPSYYAIYVLPALYLFATRGMLVKYALLITSILLSTSGLGIFVATASIFFFFRYVKFTYLIICIVFLVLFLLMLENLRELLISRFSDVLFDGGTLRDRLFPVMNIFDVSIANFGLVNSVLHQQISDKDTIDWYNSFIYMIAMFGWLCIFPIFLIAYRLGVSGAVVYALLLFTTNAFSGAYLLVVLVCWYAIKNSQEAMDRGFHVY